MSFLFGKKKEEKKVDIKATVFLIKDSISTLEKRRDYLQNSMDRERNTAREWMKKGNKDKALLHMKKLKLYERESNVIDGNIYNLETQRLTIESFVTSKNIIDVMTQAAQVLKQGPDPDKVSDLVDDINDSMQEQQEISQELSRPIGPVMDEDELLAELQEFEEKEIDKELKKNVVIPNIPNIPNIPVMPNVPNVPVMPNVHVIKVNKEEDEFKELESLIS